MTCTRKASGAAVVQFTLVELHIKTSNNLADRNNLEEIK